jgi:hypothetical protein
VGESIHPRSSRRSQGALIEGQRGLSSASLKKSIHLKLYAINPPISSVDILCKIAPDSGAYINEVRSAPLPSHIHPLTCSCRHSSAPPTGNKLSGARSTHASLKSRVNGIQRTQSGSSRGSTPTRRKYGKIACVRRVLGIQRFWATWHRKAMIRTA